MKTVPVVCPFCDDDLIVQELHCRQCDTIIRGRFQPGAGAEFDEAQLPVLRRFALLSPEQLTILEAFVRCEGKLNRLQEEMGVSYPTLRARLNEIQVTMGFTPQADEKASGEERSKILDDLANGEITAQEATHLLKGLRI